MRILQTGADPGSPVGGRGSVLGGRGPPTQALFGENECENERIESHRGGVHRKILYVDPPMTKTCRKCETHLHKRLYIVIALSTKEMRLNINRYFYTIRW